MQRQAFSFAAFFLVFSAIIALAHYYLWHRLVRAPNLGRPWDRTGAGILIAFALMIPCGVFIARILPRAAAGPVTLLIFGWFGLAAILLSVLFASEIVRTSIHALSALFNRPLDPERRTFLSRIIATTAGMAAFGLAGSGVASALGEVQVRPVRVALRRLPDALSGFRIVQISDVHIGPTIGGAWLGSIVARINDLAPDLIVITGDLVDGSVEQLREHVAPLGLLSARHGVYFVTGNHEYYSGADAWIAELGRLGIRVLRNERVTIGHGSASFDLAGVDDWTARNFDRGHGPDLAKALQGWDRGRELVLLAHQPKQIIEAAAHGVGLQLSGHTHGGQIFPGNILARLAQPYIAGLARHGDTQIYVSRGTGYWGPPMRVGAPAEITLIALFAEAHG